MLITTLPDSIIKESRLMEASLSANPKLARMFDNCFLSTLKTTTEVLDDGSTFVITGDIPALWLRDSSCQVNQYLPLAAGDERLSALIRGLIRRQFQCIAIDPYANAFNRGPDGAGHQDDLTAMGPMIWERKYEVDSLCYPLRLAHRYWKATADASIFDETLRAGIVSILDLWTREQRHAEASPYSFTRLDCPASDTLPCGGKGSPVGWTGMTWSGFRPSDDACVYGYLVPANMFAVVALGHAAQMARGPYADAALAERALSLRAQIDAGLRRHAIVEHPAHGRIWAYEVDGLGNALCMDDANVPSLLSAPYLGYCAPDDPLYLATRRFILCRDNPYWFSGAHAAGVGSPHTRRGNVWPISLVMQALTATDPAEGDRLLETLLATDAGTEVMHESFDADEPARFTRSWFAWANSLFAEWVRGRVRGVESAGRGADGARAP
jgi:uncharacterized protein